MGVRTVVWSGSEVAEPTDGVADVLLAKGFEDEEARERFCAEVDFATVEFENIPLETLRAVEERVPLFPQAESIGICQHRSREKAFFRERGIPCAPFALVESFGDLERAYAELGPVAVLKTAAFGYDGKGQVKIGAVTELEAAWEAVSGERSVLEGFVDFVCEVSVLVARNGEGEVRNYPVVENEHRHHVLDFTMMPARVSEEIRDEAVSIARRLVDEMDYRGLLAVEFFVERSGRVLVNEMAPRPHNSGHVTMDACVTSQFEQQLRAVCGMPLGSTEVLSPGVMLNLLGDMWVGGLDEGAILGTEGAKLHLYGKKEVQGLRKMGHVNLVGGENPEMRARDLKEKLLS